MSRKPWKTQRTVSLYGMECWLELQTVICTELGTQLLEEIDGSLQLIGHNYVSGDPAKTGRLTVSGMRHCCQFREHKLQWSQSLLAQEGSCELDCEFEVRVSHAHLPHPLATLRHQYGTMQQAIGAPAEWQFLIFDPGAAYPGFGYNRLSRLAQEFTRDYPMDAQRLVNAIQLIVANDVKRTLDYRTALLAARTLALAFRHLPLAS